MQTSSISRRSALAAAAGLAASIPAAGQSRMSESTIRVGLVGVPDQTAVLRQIAALGQLHMAVAAAWDPDTARAASVGKASPIGIVKSPEEMLKAVDAVLVTADRLGPSSSKHAHGFLRSGTPVWIDGPLAPSVEQAKQLLALASQHKAPLMAASVEEFFATTQYLRRKALELAPLTAAMVTVSTLGKQNNAWVGAEAVNLLCSIFGPSASKVHRIIAPGQEQNYTVTFEYQSLKGGRPMHIVAQAIPQSGSRIWGRLYGTDMVDREHLYSDDPDEDWSISYLPAALAFHQMIRTRNAPQDPDYLLAKTRLYLAACRSSDDPQGKMLAVSELKDKWSLRG